MSSSAKQITPPPLRRRPDSYRVPPPTERRDNVVALKIEIGADERDFTVWAQTHWHKIKPNSYPASTVTAALRYWRRNVKYA